MRARTVLAAAALAALALGLPAHQAGADHWHERSIECEQALALRDFATDAIPQLEAAGVSARNWQHVQRLARLQTARACAPWLHVEKRPAAAVRKPIDQDWLDDVLAGLDEPTEPPTPPQRVTLGVDCSKPLTISLPDDVLIECE